MTKVTVKALDTFHDSRFTPSHVHAGHQAVGSKSAAEDLQEMKLVKILGDAEDDQEPEIEETEEETETDDDDKSSDKKNRGNSPKNKMMTNNRNNK